MSNMLRYDRSGAGNVVMAASRQIWLAGLGAAVVSREWAEKEAGNVFRTLVKEGSAVQSRTLRKVNVRLEGSLAQANKLWQKTRHGVQTAVEAYRDTALALVKRSAPIVHKPARTATKKRVVKAATRSVAKQGKRTAKRASAR
jgi:hypothetical protein